MSEIEPSPDDTGFVSAMDTPIREKRPFGEETPNNAREKRGRSSLGGPPKTQMTLREQEKVIDSVKKENFGLKMHVHFLQERLAKLAPEHMEETINSNIRLKIEVQSRGVEIKKLKKLVLELEKELKEFTEKDPTEGNSISRDEHQAALDSKDDEIRELKRRLRVADTKQASLSASASQPSLRRLHDDNNLLAERKAELEDELDRVHDALNEAKDRVQELESLNDRYQEEADSNSTRRRLRDAEEHSEELQRRIEEYVAVLQERAEDEEILREEMERLRAELEDSERRRQAEMADRSVSRAEILEEREGKEALEQNANEYRDKLAAANIELEQREDEIEELRSVQEQMENEYRLRLDENETYIEKQAKVIDSLEAEKARLENTMEELHDKMETTIQHLQDQISEKEAERDAALRELDDLREDMVAANKEIDEQGKRIWELEDALDAERESADTLQRQVEEYQEEHDRIIPALKDKIADKNAQLEDTRNKYEELRQQLIAQADRSVEIDSHARAMEDEADAERNAKLRALEDIDKLSDRLHETESRLRDEQRARKEAEDGERSKRRQIEDLQRSLKESEDDLESLRRLLAQREHDVAEMQSTLNNLESESRKLGESHSTDRFALELELERVRRDLVRAEDDLERMRKEASNRDEKDRARENTIDKLHADNRDLAAQLSAQTQARLNFSEKLDHAQERANTATSELADLKARYADMEKRLTKDQRLLQNQENNYRDQLTERNTLLLTIYQYMDKILGSDKTPKKGAVAAKPLTNFGVFHEELMGRLKAMVQISSDFERRAKALEAKFVDKFNELKKQLDQRWKQIDKFETGLKSVAERQHAWKRKYYTKEGELEAAKSSNAEIAAQLASLRRSATGSAELTASESRGMATRVQNADRRAAHAANLLLKRDEELEHLRDKLRQQEERAAARFKELERINQNETEKVKQEKQGSKEAISVVQKDNETLREQILKVHKREEQLKSILQSNGIPIPGSGHEKRSGR